MGTSTSSRRTISSERRGCLKSMKTIVPINTTNDGCAYGVKASYFKNAAITTLTGGGGHFPCTGILEVEDEEIEQTR